MAGKSAAGDNINCGFLYGQVRGYLPKNTLRIVNIYSGLLSEDYKGTAFYPDKAAVIEVL